MLIPENFTDFLFWFKDATEASWAKEEQQTQKGSHVVNKHWIGMCESAISEVEKKYAITFPPDFREFLKILHTINIKDEDHFYFNWLEDEAVIIDKLNFPYASILQDKIWLDSWGVRSDVPEVMIDKFNEWYQAAPKLIPIFGHRYMVSASNKTGNPILSVLGSDTIIHGWNLKHYLLNEFTENMPDALFKKFYDEEDDSWYFDYKDEIRDAIDSNWLHSSYEAIPYWGELIQYSNGAWQYQPRKK